MSGMKQERSISSWSAINTCNLTLNTLRGNFCRLFWLWRSPLPCCWRYTIRMGGNVFNSILINTVWCSRIVRRLKQWSSTFRVPRELASGGWPEFTAELTSQFLKTWYQSIGYHWRATQEWTAEAAAKTVKRLMRANVGPCGTLNNDKFLRTMLQLRNTPDADCGVWSAEIV